jgi:CRISPR system Cascade subunit CasC
MLIQVHMLHTYGPGNLNRDREGYPKSCTFGGVTRSRISSQCLKRRIRRSEEYTDAAQGHTAVRTRQLPSLLRAKLKEMDVDPEARDLILSRAPEIGREGKESGDIETKREEETNQVLFFADAEVEALAQSMLVRHDEMGAKAFGKAPMKEVMKGVQPASVRCVDTALFGRMTTSAAFPNVDSAMQMAHAVSTHRSRLNVDYFATVDELKEGGGAGLIGERRFNSATYYKYFNIHWETLLDNLLGDVELARLGVLGALRAAMQDHPTGAQNAFARFDPFDLVLIEIGAKNLQMNYGKAFLKPVEYVEGESIAVTSARALDVYIQQVSATFAPDVRRACLSLLDETGIAGAEEKTSVDELLVWVDESLPSNV